MLDQDKIRERIRERIAATPKLSVAGASKKAGLGDTTLRNFLKGMTRSMTMDSLSKLAPVLGVTVDWLATGEKPRADAGLFDLGDIFERLTPERQQLARALIEQLASGESDSV